MNSYSSSSMIVSPVSLRNSPNRTNQPLSAIARHSSFTLTHVQPLVFLTFGCDACFVDVRFRFVDATSQFCELLLLRQHDFFVLHVDLVQIQATGLFEVFEGSCACRRGAAKAVTVGIPNTDAYLPRSLIFRIVDVTRLFHARELFIVIGRSSLEVHSRGFQSHRR